MPSPGGLPFHRLPDRLALLELQHGDREVLVGRLEVERRRRETVETRELDVGVHIELALDSELAALQPVRLADPERRGGAKLLLATDLVPGAAGEVLLEVLADLAGEAPLHQRPWGLALAEAVDAGGAHEARRPRAHVPRAPRRTRRWPSGRPDTGWRARFRNPCLLLMVRKGGFEPPWATPTRS